MTESGTEDLDTEKISSETYMVPGLQGKLVISRMPDSQYTKQEEKNREAGSLEKSIEEIFEELDQIMEKLEAADTSLEDSFSLYEAGIKLVRACGKKIDKVEKQIIVLQERPDETGG